MGTDCRFGETGTSGASLRKPVPYRCQGRLFAVNGSLLIIFVFSLVAGAGAQKYNTKVSTTIPVCPKPVLVSFTDKPKADLCSDIVRELAPSTAVFYANLILSTVVLLTLVAVLLATYVTGRSIGDVETTARIGRYVNSYIRYNRDLDEVS